MNKAAAPQRKRRKDFIPYFLGFVVFLYCSVQLVSFAAEAAPQRHRDRLRRALGKSHSSQAGSSDLPPIADCRLMSRWVCDLITVCISYDRVEFA